MKINQKTSAFTVMELLIAMLISAIAISVAYTVLSMIGKQYQIFNANQHNITNAIQLNYLLTRDFDDAEDIKFTRGILLFKKNKGNVTYQLNDSLILRTDLVADTFRVKVGLIEPRFAMNKVLSDDTSTNRIDELNLTLFFLTEKLQFSYYKDFSAQTFFNEYSNTSN